MMSDEFPKDCDVEDDEGLAEFSVHVNSHQDRLAVQSEKLGAGSLHDTESKMEEFKKQLLSDNIAKMKEKIQKAREKLQDKENMDQENIKKTVSDLQHSSLKLFEIASSKWMWTMMHLRPR